MKKNLLLLLSFFVVVSAYGYDFVVDGLYYNIISFEDKTVTLAGGDKESGLKGNIVIPGTINVGDVTFNVISVDSYVGCEVGNISAITFSEGIQEIGEKAFYTTNWEYLSYISYPSSLQSVGSRALECKMPYYIYIHDVESWMNVENHRNLGYLGYQAHLRYGKKYRKFRTIDNDTDDFIVPEGITSIPKSSFYGVNINSVTFPSTLTKVDGFTGAYMNNVYLNVNNTEIESYAFSDCQYLSYITTPNNISYIGEGAFQNCVKLSTFIINEGVEAIYEKTFMNCTNLTKVQIPSTCKSLGDQAFYGCSKADTIVLGKGLETIGKNVFDACNSLITIISLSDEAPTIDESAFTTGQYMLAKLIVPVGSKQKYQNAAGWQKFQNIIEENGYDPEIHYDTCAKPTIRYEEGEIKFFCSTEGVSFRSEIASADVAKYQTPQIKLNATYTITVIAHKDYCYDSEIAKATLIWATDESEESEVIDEVIVKSRPLLILQDDGDVTIGNLNDCETVAVYSMEGTLVATTVATDGFARIDLSDMRGQIVAVKVGNKCAKFTVS